MRLPSKTTVIPILVIGLAVGYLISTSFNQSMVYYYTVEEFQSQLSDLGTRGIRISGIATAIETRAEISNFDMVGGHQNLAVVYQGLVPDTFKEGSEVVVEGRWDSVDRQFEATILLAKCPSKYEEVEPEGQSIS
ncbi:MAG: cytochrome c maturation protein CcmE [Acidobacteriota bacterium]